MGGYDQDRLDGVEDDTIYADSGKRATITDYATPALSHPLPTSSGQLVSRHRRVSVEKTRLQRTVRQRLLQ